MARLLWWVLLYYFDVVFYLLQIFCTSGFEYDQKVVENYLHAPVISITAAIGSPEKTRCSVEGKIAKVNDFFSVRCYVSRLCAVVMCLSVCYELMIFMEIATCLDIHTMPDGSLGL